MSKYNDIFLGQKAKELNFIRDTFEKVTRLVDILEYFNQKTILRDSLALKGGTAINLTIFDLPRLSVDIDLDYLVNNSKEEMLSQRELINAIIFRYMISQGYTSSTKSRNPLSLDSWVFEYISAGGNKENIKIEINYSLRAHLFSAEYRQIKSKHFSIGNNIKTLNPIEIYGSKIIALISRAAVRDLYDTRNMINFKVFDKPQEDLLRKAVVFYAAISAKEIKKTFDTKAIDSITERRIKTELLPVIKKGDWLDLKATKTLVCEYISNLMVVTLEEKEFLKRFEKGEYIPELLFNNITILDNIRNHPMALWKTKK